jgi:pimeloyl-ACP methyl ester carboxylesterase
MALLLASILALLLAACGGQSAAPASLPPSGLPSFQRGSCAYPVPSGLSADCGYLVVPVRHSQPNGATLKPAVMVYKARAAGSSAGSGAGQAATIFIEGGPGPLPPVFPPDVTNFFTPHGDFVLFDQRGFGKSQPAMNCPEVQKAGSPIPTSAFVACRDRLSKEGVNVAAFNVREDADDVNDLREALGYSKVNLYGTSYGTKGALEVVRYHPDAVRSLLLDGTLSPQFNDALGTGTTIQDAQTNVFRACEADSACAQKYPKLEATFKGLEGNLEKSPATITLTNPATKKAQQAVLTPATLQSVMDAQLSFLPTAVPALVESLGHKDYAAVDRPWRSSPKTSVNWFRVMRPSWPGIRMLSAPPGGSHGSARGPSVRTR